MTERRILTGLSDLLIHMRNSTGFSGGQWTRFSSGEEFLGAFTAGKYDLIFLDIYMDGITGMETAKRIRRADHGCRIIFITTSPEFAVESYDVSASFYLLKPIEKNGVFAALDRCGLQDAERTRAVEVATHFGKTVLPVPRYLLHRVCQTAGSHTP